MTQASNSTGTTVLEGDREIVTTRVFDAPRALVFEAWTKAEHLKKWWGPRGYEVTQCEVDLRPGGAYRIVHRAPDGEVYGFRGVYQEMEPPARIVQTFIFDGMPDQEAIETHTLEERDGKTLYTGRTTFPNAESRDGAVAGGMNEGAAESLDRLEELLVTMQG